MEWQNSFIFDFEKNFENQNAKSWMVGHWVNSMLYSVIYILVVFGLKQLMEKRVAFKIDRVLVVWNVSLALFSILGFYRTFPEFFHILTNYGFYESVCDSSFIASNKVTGGWLFLFVLSKLPEFGDTIFLVLRKRPLTFLHVYHHIIALIYTWFSYKEFSSTTRWFTVMNLFVHSIMYSYYALSAMKCKPPRQVAMMITGLQIIQMIIGCIVNVAAYGFIALNIDCHVTRTNVDFSMIMYVSFLFLFGQFFINSYISGKQSRTKIGISNKQE